MALDVPTDQNRLRSELIALTEVAKTLTAPLELTDLLDAVMQTIPGVLEAAEYGLVMLWDQPAGLFRPAASFGFNPQIINELGLRAGESITGKVYDLGKAYLLCKPEDVAQAMNDLRPANRAVFTRAIRRNQLPACTLAAPLMVSEQKYGVLLLGTFSMQDAFTINDLPFVQTLTDLIALAIDRARLEARADAVREARQAEKMRSEIMAVLSHELRLPLTAIQGYASALLLEDICWEESKRKEFLIHIDEECHHMQIMLRNILDSSLIDVDQLVIEREPVRLGIIAHAAAVESQRRAENHRIVVDFPPDFPILLADPRWVKQVFRNILDNAIKYSPDGGLIVIRAEQRAHDVVVSTADQGIGISPEDLIPLFEKFYRVRRNGHLQIPGTGLGLPIARAIVEAHGGRIWVESKIGEGTTLNFSLPLPDIMLGNPEDN
ncbi:MAG: ATP-binding protein [Anaerolineales bacterium]|nr:ATP-binding protein [Anaerolineales bacterium]